VLVDRNPACGFAAIVPRTDHFPATGARHSPAMGQSIKVGSGGPMGACYNSRSRTGGLPPFAGAGEE